jgi:LysM repeat protein
MARVRIGNQNAAVTVRPVLERNRVKYIIAKSGDTYESLAHELGKLDWEMPRYNDTDMQDSIVAGQVVYLQPKRNKAEPGKRVHVVKPGESLYSISQLYAIKMSSLRTMNQLGMNTQPQPGTGLQLRKVVKSSASGYDSKQPVPDDDEHDEIRVELDLE